MNDVSIILGYRKSLPDKESNLKVILQYYKTQYPDSEIVVVEQDNVSKFNDKDVNHVFVKNDGLYNRSWSFNVGMNCCKYEKVLFADIDCYFPVDINPISKLLDSYDVVVPFTKFCQLDRTSTIRIKSGNFDKALTVESVLYPNIGAGVLFANKTKIKDIGSWPEEFEGWGGEDDVMSIKIKHRLSYTQTTNNLIHLYHERNKMISSNGHERYDFNRRQALEIVPRMSKEQLDEYIEEGKQTNVGNINKYKN